MPKHGKCPASCIQEYSTPKQEFISQKDLLKFQEQQRTQLCYQQIMLFKQNTRLIHEFQEKVLTVILNEQSYIAC